MTNGFNPTDEKREGPKSNRGIDSDVERSSFSVPKKITIPLPIPTPMAAS
jgi:hypothetical protein